MSTEVQSIPEQPQLTDDPTTRLRRMLDSVRLEKTSQHDQSIGHLEDAVCPQCTSPEPWGQSSWCPECGYYPKLGRSMTSLEIEANLNESPRASLSWLIGLISGTVLIVAANIAIRIMLPDLAQRGPIGRILFVVGLFLLILAQIRAYLLATREQATVSISTIFFEPFELWMVVCKKLPHSRQILYWGVWGATTMMLALALVGLDFEGMFSGLRPRRKSKSPMPAVIKTLAATEGQSAFASFEEESGNGFNLEGGQPTGRGENMETAMKEFAGSAGTDSIAGTDKPTTSKSTADKSTAGENKPFGDMSPLNRAEEDDASDSSSIEPKKFDLAKVPISPRGKRRIEQATFTIFGYSINSAGKLRSILLADVSSHRARFVSKMSLDETDESLRNQLQAKLDQIRTRRAALWSPYHARWVSPVITCQVAYVGWTPDGHLKEGYMLDYQDSRHAAPPQ